MATIILGALGAFLALVTFASKQGREWNKIAAIAVVIGSIGFLVSSIVAGTLGLARELPDLLEHGPEQAVIAADICIGVVLAVLLVDWIAGRE